MTALVVRDLTVAWGELAAVRGVDLEIGAGEWLGMVGESGCGKSTLVQACLALLPPPGRVVRGEVSIGGHRWTGVDEATLRPRRWRDVAVVPQAALDCLHPMLTAGAQLDETLAAHTALGRSARRARALELLEMVELPAEVLGRYPHELSGGMRQRVVLATALALAPPLLVLDEPTTALDARVEREILDRVSALQRSLGFAVWMVTHDVRLLERYASGVAVMYAGRLVERGTAAVWAEGGRHPYTRALLAAQLPRPGEARIPVPIPGQPPSLVRPPSGCRFHPRCAAGRPTCASGPEPELVLGVSCPMVSL